MKHFLCAAAVALAFVAASQSAAQDTSLTERLIDAVESNDLPMAERLIEDLNADVNAKGGKYGWTPLHVGSIATKVHGATLGRLRSFSRAVCC